MQNTYVYVKYMDTHTKALQLNVKLLKFMTNLQNNGHIVRTESTVADG